MRKFINIPFCFSFLLILPMNFVLAWDDYNDLPMDQQVALNQARIISPDKAIAKIVVCTEPYFEEKYRDFLSDPSFNQNLKDSKVLKSLVKNLNNYDYAIQYCAGKGNDASVKHWTDVEIGMMDMIIKDPEFNQTLKKIEDLVLIKPIGSPNELFILNMNYYSAYRDFMGHFRKLLKRANISIPDYAIEIEKNIKRIIKEMRDRAQYPKDLEKIEDAWGVG